MALKKAGIELDLKNDAAYKAGLKEIEFATRALSAETKLAVAQLGSNASATQNYTTRMAGLKSQMDYSQKTANSYRNALEKLPETQKVLKERIDSTTEAWKASSEKTRELEKEYYRLGRTTGWTSEETVKAKHAWKDQEATTKSLNESLQQMTKTHDANALRMKELPALMKEAELATELYKQEQIKLHNEWRNQGGVLADYANGFKDLGGKLTNAGRKMMEFGRGMTTYVTAPIALGFGMAIKEAIGFQSQIKSLGPLMSNGGTLTAGMRMEIDKLSDASRKYAIEYGKSTTEINESLAEFVRTGFNAQETMAMLPHILDASIASGENFNDVMSSGIEGLMQFGLNAGDVGVNMQRVTDAYTNVANATKSGITDIGMAMSYVGSTANGLGMSLEETAAMVGILTNRGLEASMAGTGLRAVLASLANPSKTAAGAMETLGINTDEFTSGAIGLPDIIAGITEATQDLTEEQRTALLIQAFGRVGANAMNALVAEGKDGIVSLTEETKKATGVTKDMAEQMRNTPQFKLDQSISQLKDLGIEIGEKLMPTFINAIDTVTSWIATFGDLDSSTQDFIINTGLIVAAIGPVIMVIGGLLSALGSISTAIGTVTAFIGKLITPLLGLESGASFSAGAVKLLSGALTFLSNPATIAIAAIAAVSAVYLALTEDSREAADAMRKFPDITDVTAKQAESILGTSEAYSTLTLSLETLAEETIQYKDDVSEAVSQIVDEIKKLNSIDDKKLSDMFSQLPPEVAAMGKAVIEEQRKVGDARIERAKEVESSINAIMETAATEKRNISDRERAYIISANDELAMLHAESLAQTSEQGKQIYATLTADLQSMTQDQLAIHGQNVQKSLIALDDAFAKQKQLIMDNQESLGVEVSEKMLSALETSTKATKDKLIREWSNALSEMYENNGVPTDKLAENVINSIEAMTGTTIEALGYSREEIANFIAQGESRINEGIHAMFSGIEDNAAYIQASGNKLEFALGGILDSMGMSFVDLKNNADINLTELGTKLQEAGVSWGDIQNLLQAGAEGELNLDDYEFIKRLAEANTEWAKEWERKKLAVEIDESGLRDVTTLASDWDNLTLEEKQAEVLTRGQEGIDELIETIGIYSGLSDAEVKQFKSEATGREALENILVLIGEWKDMTLPEKRAVLETQIDNDAIREGIESANLWDNAEFVRQLAIIDTNAPDAQEKILSLINEYRAIQGLPPIAIEADADTASADENIRKFGGALDEVDGRQVVVKVSEDGSIVVKGGIDSVAKAIEDADGGTITTTFINESGETVIQEMTAYELQQSALNDKNVKVTFDSEDNVTVTAQGITDEVNAVPESKVTTLGTSILSAIGNMLGALSLSTYISTLESIPESKSTDVTINADGVPKATQEVNAFNDSVTAMKGKTVTLTTRIPSLTSNTSNVRSWNTAMNNTRNKSSSLRTSVPNIVGNTNSVWAWVRAVNASYSKTSTLRTVHVKEYQTVGKHATGGHIPMFAKGGNLTWGGMFASGASMVPRDYMGIVGEAGPELFRVTKNGVSITPLSSGEKARGIRGALEDYAGGSGQGVTINVEINHPVVREDNDIVALSKMVGNTIMKEIERNNIMRKGRANGFA